MAMANAGASTRSIDPDGPTARDEPPLDRPVADDSLSLSRDFSRWIRSETEPEITATFLGICCCSSIITLP